MYSLANKSKDCIATHPNLGMDTTAGCWALAGSRPKENANVIEKVLLS